MRNVIENLYSGDKNLELYLGIIEAVEGITRNIGTEAWLQTASGDPSVIDSVQKLVVEAGLMGLGIPEKHGGSGGGLLGPVLLTELLSRCGVGSFQSIITQFSRHPVVKYGTDAQIEKYVCPTITGEKSFCILATEPNAGTNTFNITTRAKRSDSKWILNGQKIWISAADKADYGFLIAKTDIDKPMALSIFVVDMKASGISMTKLNSHVFPTENQYSVFFDNVELSADALIGEEGNGAKYMFEGLNPERFIVTAFSLGLSDLVLKITTKYVNQRAPFGAPIGSYQSVQHPLAKNKAHVDAARLMLYHGVKLYDQGKNAGVQANMAKYLSSIASTNMADDAIQFHGGSGMDDDTGILAIWKICRTMKIAPINNEMVLNFIAEHDIGLPKSY